MRSAFAILLALVCALSVRAFNPRVHAFYYLWYGAPDTDGAWIHWNHTILAHWDEDIRQNFPFGLAFVPPYDVHSPFYPMRGPYSSRNKTIIRQHMQTMYDHGIGVAVISWWGRPGVSGGDSQGVITDEAVQFVLDGAHEVGVKVAFHLEPYVDRTVETIHADLTYLKEKYLRHPAIYKYYPKGLSGPALPMFYLYDSYHIESEQWERLLQPGRDLSVRGTDLDGYYVALWVDYHHGRMAHEGGFNAGYTYFAAQGMTYGSTFAHWPIMKQFSANTNDEFAFLPSVGPGYDDSKIRPWNADNSRDRSNGEYYAMFWEKALESNPPFVTITSFNEWGEGTQIEEAVPLKIDTDTMVPKEQCLPKEIRDGLGLPEAYQDYSPQLPTFYLDQTLKFSRKLARAWHIAIPGGDPEVAAATPMPEFDVVLAREREAARLRREAMLAEEAEMHRLFEEEEERKRRDREL
jgi:glycoprotein endo-alpha-1,2-mannosidase